MLRTVQILKPIISDLTQPFNCTFFFFFFLSHRRAVFHVPGLLGGEAQGIVGSCPEIPVLVVARVLQLQTSCRGLLEENN